ncbi:MAG: glycosyltransferase family 2 protein [Deltaproteobacteria bacterium]|nr:glycosyltransferase family 2 protein [Deltaproteobacteria bacterium]MBI3387312.1 glycosyltransferase family 2 protein [Deltaproteobacteria bacterium]
MESTDVERDPALAGGVSIVIAVLNQLDYTRECLSSIRACTDLPHEVIIVDNGSRDGSAEVCAAAGCRVIRNEQNLGCARAWNQGIRAARAPLILIMNNDIVVSAGWLGALAEFQQRTGAAVVSPAVINGSADYELATMAAQYRHRFGDRWRPGWRGECFLVPRAVYDQVGLFDERFVGGGFEDDDFDIRLRRARLRTAITGAALIHHFSQVTQRALAGTAWKRVKNPNKTLLESKWGWRLRLRRVRKELEKLWHRMRAPAFRGRDPYDVLVVWGDERVDLDAGVKRLRPAAGAIAPR